MRPLFLAIEGIDGSGGTTQTRMLASWFCEQGMAEVLTTCEPSSGPVGQFIRRALVPDDPVARLGDAVLPYLFAADRRDHLDREIIPALQRGAVVVTDRYYHSSFAYQSLAVGMAAVAALNAGFRAPDLTVLLDLEPEECLARIQARGGAPERFEALDRLRQVRESYNATMMHCRARGEHVVWVSALGSPEEVHERILLQVKAFLSTSPPTHTGQTP